MGDDEVFEDYNTYLDLRAQKYLAYEDETALDNAQYEPIRQSAFKVVKSADQFTQDNSKIGLLVPKNKQTKINSNKNYVIYEEAKDADLVEYEPIKQSSFKIINNTNQLTQDKKFERLMLQNYGQQRSMTGVYDVLNTKYFTNEEADGNNFVQFEPTHQSKIEIIKNPGQKYQLTQDFNNDTSYVQKLMLRNAEDNFKLKRLMEEKEKMKNIKNQKASASKEPNSKNPIIYEEAFLESSKSDPSE